MEHITKAALAALKVCKTNIIQRAEEYKDLINTAITLVGIDNIENVAINGIMDGLPEGITTKSLVSFWVTYKPQIQKYFKTQANDLGVSVVNLLYNTPCLDPFRQDDVIEAFYDSYNPDHDPIYFYLSKFTIETICASILDELETLKET